LNTRRPVLIDPYNVAVSRYRWRLVLIAWFFNWSNHDEKQRTSDALLS
jgi:hypothetical protein